VFEDDDLAWLPDPPLTPQAPPPRRPPAEDLSWLPDPPRFETLTGVKFKDEPPVEDDLSWLPDPPRPALRDIQLGREAKPLVGLGLPSESFDVREAGRAGTPLGRAADESQFQAWYGDWARRNRMDPNADSPEQHYDYRAAFRAGVPPPDTLAGEHWPSTDKDAGHPNLVVGGFNTKTGQPEPGATLELDVQKLIAMGWEPEAAAELVARHGPKPVQPPGAGRGGGPGGRGGQGPGPAAQPKPIADFPIQMISPDGTEVFNVPASAARYYYDKGAKPYDPSMPITKKADVVPKPLDLEGKLNVATRAAMPVIMQQFGIKPGPQRPPPATWFEEQAADVAERVAAGGEGPPPPSDLARQVTGEVQAPTPQDTRSIWEKALDMSVGTAMEVGGVVAGSIAGGVLGSEVPVVGTAAGMAAGGFAGGSTGNLARQAFNQYRGLHGDVKLAPALVAGVGGAINLPGGPLASAGKNLLYRGAQNAPIGLATYVAQEYAEGREPTLEGAATATGMSALFGAGLGAMEGKALQMQLARELAAEKAAALRRGVSAVSSEGGPQTKAGFFKIGEGTIPQAATTGELSQAGATAVQAASQAGRVTARATAKDGSKWALIDGKWEQTEPPPEAPGVVAPTPTPKPLPPGGAAGAAEVPPVEPTLTERIKAGPPPPGEALDNSPAAIRARMAAAAAQLPRPAAPPPRRTGRQIAPLPKELAGAAPRYQTWKVTFESPLDKAAYILAQTKESARDADYLAYVMEQTGFDEAGARAYGAETRSRIGALTGSAKGDTIRLPAGAPGTSARFQPKPVQTPQQALEAGLASVHAPRLVQPIMRHVLDDAAKYAPADQTLYAQAWAARHLHEEAAREALHEARRPAMGREARAYASIGTTANFEPIPPKLLAQAKQSPDPALYLDAWFKRHTDQVVAQTAERAKAQLAVKRSQQFGTIRKKGTGAVEPVPEKAVKPDYTPLSPAALARAKTAAALRRPVDTPLTAETLIAAPIPKRFADLPPIEQRQVRRIVTELSELEYEQGTVTPEASELSGYKRKAREPNAAVYQDINALGKTRTAAAMRQSAQAWIEGKGRYTDLTDNIVRSARARAYGTTLKGKYEGTATSIPESLANWDTGPGQMWGVPKKLGTPYAAKELETIERVGLNTSELIEAYEAKHGRVYNGDDFSTLLGASDQPGDWAHYHAVRGSATALTDEAYTRALRSAPEETAHQPILMTGGGPGSGKSSSLERMGPDFAYATLDTSMRDLNRAEGQIEQALRKDRGVLIDYTYLDPVEAFRRTLLRQKTEGRPVPLDDFIDAHLQAPKTLAALHNRFGGPDTGVVFSVFDNSAGADPNVPRDVAWVLEQAAHYNDAGALRSQLTAVLDDAVRAGDVTPAQAAALQGQPPGPGGAGAALPGGVRPDSGRVEGGGGAGGAAPEVIDPQSGAFRPEIFLPWRWFGRRVSQTGAGGAAAGGPPPDLPAPGSPITLRATAKDGSKWAMVGGKWLPEADAEAVTAAGRLGGVEGELPAKRGRPTVSDIEWMAKAEGKPITPPRLIEPADVVTPEMFTHFPKDQRDNLVKLLTDLEGATGQRREVQPWARSDDLSRYLVAERTKVVPKGTIVNAEETIALKNALTTVNKQVDELSAQLKTGNLDEWGQMELLKAQKAQVILMQNWMGVRAEQGRALNVHKRMGEIVQSKDLRALRAALSIPELRQMKNFADEWATLTTDEMKMEFLRTHQPKLSKLDVVLAVRYANILSGVKTSLRNVGGSSVNALFRTASSVPAVGYDIVRTAVTRGKVPRSIYLGEFGPDMARASARGLKQGWDDGWFALTRGYSQADLKQFDVPRQELRWGGKNPFNWPGRALEAQDQFMAGPIRAMALERRLYARGRGMGLRGAALDEQLVKWRLAPPEEVVQAAERETEEALFREDPGPILKWFLRSKTSDSAGLRFLSGMVVPFARVPGNMLRQSTEWLPGGAWMTRQGRAAMATPGREQSEVVGRMVLGSTAVGLLAYWAAMGKISGTGPRDPEVRARLKEEGWIPNGVNLSPVTNKWIDYQVLLQPIAPSLSLVANAYELFRRNGEMPDWGTLAASVGGSILDRSFLTGLSDLNAALNDPERSGKRWLHSTTQSFVPFSGLERNITQSIDPVERDPQTALEAAQSIIPGLSTSVQPKLTRFGQPVERPGDPVSRGFSPFTISPESTDPVVRALALLGIENLALPAKKLNATRELPEIELTVAERQQMGQMTRAALEQVFAMPEVQALMRSGTAADKAEAHVYVQRAVEQARAQARIAIRTARESVARR
jgi:hypothetical protein